jgi:hypothetical protein
MLCRENAVVYLSYIIEFGRNTVVFRENTDIFFEN